TVSEVTVSPDLRVAVAYILPLGGIGGDEVVKAARSHIPYIRSILAHNLSLKYVPTLNFVKDTAFENKTAMDELLSNPHIAQDLGERPSDETEETDSKD
ncbi:MAG: ribosome-binding factor A, partial [Rhizobiales bacterium]|nr:ribosome-binding factor A [Hyphomicrobiales bacterium]